MTVRRATQADTPAILSMMHAMHVDGSFADVPISEEACLETLRGLTGDNGIILVAEGEHGLYGFLLAQCFPYFFSRAKMVADLAVWLNKDHRGGITAVRMLSALSQWAALVGAREIYLGVSHNVDPERVGALYERSGYTRLGGI